MVFSSEGLPQNKFSTLAILKPEDADEHGKPRDEKGLKVKYTCQHPGCTKRKMGYKGKPTKNWFEKNKYLLL